jgi:hypothetical protein
VRTVVDDDGAVVDPAVYLAAWAKPHFAVHAADLYLAGELVQRNLPISAGRVAASGLAGVRTRCSGVTLPTRVVDPRLSPDGWEIDLKRGLVIPDRFGAIGTLTDYITYGGSYITYGDSGFVAAPGSGSTVVGVDVFGSTLWVSQGILAIQESSVSDAGGEAITRLDGEDLARKLDDASLMASVGWATTDTLETKLAELVQAAVPYLTFQAEGTTHPAPQIVHERKASPLEILKESARSVGYEVFLRGYTVVWRPEPDLRSSTPVCELAEGATWVEGELQLSRRDSHNAWTVVGRNPKASDAGEIVATAYDDDPASLTYWDGPFGHKPAPDERNEQVDTQPKADAAVEALKLKNRGRSRAITVESWPCAVLEPGDAVTMRRGVLSIDEAALLDEIELGMSVKDRMNVVSRTKQTVSV